MFGGVHSRSQSLREGLLKKYKKTYGEKKKKELDGEGGERFNCSKRSDDGVCYAAERLLRAWKVDGINHGVGVCAMEVHFSAGTREREMDKGERRKRHSAAARHC